MHPSNLCYRWLAVAFLLLFGCIAQAAEPSLDEIAAQLQSDDPVVKLDAAAVLTVTPRDADRMVPLLVAALADERIGQAVPAYIPAPPRLVADQAQWALEQYGAAAAVPVAKLLQHDQAKMRKRAAAVLAVIGQDASATAADIAQALGQEKDANVRSALLGAYGQVEQDEDALAKVLLTAMDDMSADYYALAIRLAGERSVQDEAIVFRIHTALNDPNTRWGSWTPDTAFPVPVRYDAAVALGQIGPAASEAAPKLREMMNSTPQENSWDTRAAAAFALTEVTGKVDEQALQLLVEIASHPERDLDAAEEAVSYLGELGAQARPALPMLRKLCLNHFDDEESPDGLVPSRAILAVAKIDGIDSLPLLIKALRSQDAFDREAAAQAIATFGPAAKSAVPHLMEAAKDEQVLLSFSARYYAIKALGKMGPAAEEAVAVLEQIRNDTRTPNLQTAAEKALEKIRAASE